MFPVPSSFEIALLNIICLWIFQGFVGLLLKSLNGRFPTEAYVIANAFCSLFLAGFWWMIFSV